MSADGIYLSDNTCHADTNFPFSKKVSKRSARQRDEKTEGTFRFGNMSHADTNFPFSKREVSSANENATKKFFAYFLSRK